MPGDFDKSKDIVLWERDRVFADDFNELNVAIIRYDTGKPKVQISRRKYDKKSQEWSFVKLGRMTYEEFSAVARATKEGFSDVAEGKQPSVPF